MSDWAVFVSKWAILLYTVRLTAILHLWYFKYVNFLKQ